ncbi:MAG: nodulation protein NfeD [Pirellulales bacterium]
MPATLRFCPGWQIRRTAAFLAAALARLFLAAAPVSLLLLAANPSSLAKTQQDQPAAEEAGPAEAAVDDSAAKIGAPSNVSAEVTAPRVGYLIPISAPLPNVDRLRRSVLQIVTEARRRGEWPVLVFEIKNGRSPFGQTLDLARFLSGRDLDGTSTIAWLPTGGRGHVVLLALACDEIAMPADAEIGQAGADEEVIGPDLLSVYSEIAQRRKTIPADVALGLLNPALEVFQVETEMGQQFVLRDALDDLERRQAVASKKVIIRAGEPGRFTGREAKDYGFVALLADDVATIARAWKLPPDSLVADPSLGTDWVPVQVNVRGPITQVLAEGVQRLIDAQIRDHDANLFIIYIDSPGGAPIASLSLAQHIAGLKSTERRTVAYVAKEARADAAFIAMGCDQIVVGPDAKIGGGWQDINPASAEVDSLTTSLVDLAERKGRSPALVAALVNPQLVVHRYTRSDTGAVDYLTAEEANERNLQEPDAGPQWARGEQVTVDGEPMMISAGQATELGLARTVVDDPEELRELYGLEKAPRVVGPGWVDSLIAVLSSDAVGWLLLLLGAGGLYIEAQSPGIGIGIFMSGVCFLLFFWAHWLGGTANWLEIVLFLAGVACVLIEVFVLPGFGIFGLGGGLLIVASLVLASQTFVLPRDDYEVSQLMHSFGVLSGAVVGFVGAAIFVRRFLPNTPGLRHMILESPSAAELAEVERREALATFDHLLGQRGKTITPLTPAGKVRIGQQLVDVLAEGSFIPTGTQVRVIEVLGPRVVVRIDE